jgi:hypothetical protein
MDAMDNPLISGDISDAASSDSSSTSSNGGTSFSEPHVQPPSATVL